MLGVHICIHHTAGCTHLHTADYCVYTFTYTRLHGVHIYIHQTAGCTHLHTPDCWVYTFIYDQYGFKPTGGTTAAIVDITHTVSIMLETNKFVRRLMIHFSKAFDSDDHLSLIQKIKSLNIADNIMQWIVSFLTDHNQYVQLNGKLSFTRIINRSIVQGSGIGPTLFIICIKDFKPIGSTNHMTKYADDANLLVPEKK